MMQQNASAWWEAVNQQLTTTLLDCWSTLTLSAGHARVLKPPADAGSKCQTRHKTLTLTFGESLWDPISNYIGLCQSKVYRMSTVTGNLYNVHRLCITEAEWAPSNCYIRPLDDDLTNLKGSHMLEKRHLPPPLISTQNLIGQGHVISHSNPDTLEDLVEKLSQEL